MDLPDLLGYELSNRICTLLGGPIIIWLSKADRQAERLHQVQLTLVGAKLSMANLEIAGCFPPLQTCRISGAQDDRKKKLHLRFEEGELCFEFEHLSFSKFSRRLRFDPRPVS